MNIVPAIYYYYYYYYYYYLMLATVFFFLISRTLHIEQVGQDVLTIAHTRTSRQRCFINSSYKNK